jgi:hypothetical protein
MNFWKFFFEKEEVEGVAVLRVFIGILLITSALLMLPGLLDYFGPQGMLKLKTVIATLGRSRLNLFSWLGDSSTILWMIFTTHLLASISMTLGFSTRLSTLIAFVTLTSLHHRNLLILNSGDTALRVVLFLLIFSRAGDAYSLDRILKLRSGKVSGEPLPQAPWALRLIQLQTTFIYLSTSIHKFDGQAWANGNAIYYTSRLWDFERFPVPYLLDHLASIHLLTWLSLALEFALGTLIWLKPLRLPLILAGICFHLCIEYSMNIPLFEFTMIALLIGMLPSQMIKNQMSAIWPRK